MAYLGNKPATGENNAFRILDDISSHVVSFNGSSASVVSVSADTITIAGSEHRYITGQRVTYSKGGGTVITGLTDATAYYVIRDSATTIQLATTASNANNGVAINLTGLGAGTAHTLTLAFDGTNTKFKPTYNDGSQNPIITRAAQLVLSLNGVIQQPIDSASPSAGFGIDVSGNIIFSTAPDANDDFWGHVHASNTVTFDISDNDIDNFTGDGSTANFNLSKTPSDNRNILVTLDGVVQYPSDNSNTRAYTLSENELQMVSAPASGVAIQVRHIGFAGPTAGGGGGVTGFYGRTGNVVLKNTDNPVIGNLTAVDAAFSGNVSIAKTLTYMDVAHVDAVGIITAQSGIQCLDDLNVGLGTFFVDKSTARVGIGTNIPASLLHLENNAPVLTVKAINASSGLRINVKGQSSGQLFRIQDDSTTKFTLLENGNLLLGTDTETNNIRLGNKFGIVGTAAYTGMSISQYAGTTAGHKPMIDFNRSRGSADGTMTSVADGDGLGEIIFRGSDGSNFEDGAAIRAWVDGTPANDTTDMPGRLTFHTSADGDTSLHERLRIESSGAMRLKSEYLRFQAGDHQVSDFSQKVGLKWTYETDIEIAKIEVHRPSWSGGPSDMLFHTCNTSGTVSEILRITNDGKVGIGITNPAEKFEVSGGSIGISGSYKIATHPLVSYASFVLDGGNYAARLGSTGTSTIRHTQIYGGGSHIATFDGVNTRLGIGKTNPDELLHIASTGTAKFRLTDNRTSISDTSQYGVIQFEQRDSNTPGVSAEVAAVMQDTTNGNTAIQFKTGTPSTIAERLRITGHGNVGINDDNPSSQLVVKATTDDNPALQLYRQSTGGDIASIIWKTGSGDQAKINYRGAAGANEGLQFYTAGGSSSQMRMIIDHSGKVGIGTNDPSYTLDVLGDEGITVSPKSNSTIGQLSIVGRNSSGAVSAISRLKSYPDGSSNQSHFAIETRNSSNNMVEALRIKSDGTTTVKCNGNSRGLELNVGSNAGSLVFDRNGHITSFIRASDGGSNVAGGSGGGSRIRLGKQQIHFDTFPYVTNVGDAVTYTERLTINAVGDVTLGYAGNSLYFQNGFNNSNSRIQNGGASNNSNLRFYTRNSGTETEKLRIHNDGQITNSGIATSYVTTKFAANFAKLDIRGTNIADSNHYILSYGEGHANDHEFHMVNTLGHLVFRTGASGQTERVRINSVGEMSIGGQHSSHAYDPNSYGNPSLLIAGDDNADILTLMNDDPTPNNNDYASLGFRIAGQSTGSYSKAAIIAERMGGYNSLDLLFCCGQDADATRTTTSHRKMRIKADGRVSINTDDARLGQSNSASEFYKGHTKLGIQGSVAIGNTGSATADYSELAFYRMVGTTAGADGRITSTHNLGRISWYGSSNDGAFPDRVWSIECIPNGGDWWAGNARRAKMSFKNQDSEQFSISSGGDVAVRHGAFSVNSETDALDYQTLSGTKTFSASNTFIGLAYVGHSHSFKVQFMILENDNQSLGGVHGEVSFYTTYGSSSGPQNQSVRRYAMNGGTITSDPTFYYCNGGCGSHGNNYVLQAKVSYTGSNPVRIKYAITGLSGASMYV